MGDTMGKEGGGLISEGVLAGFSLCSVIRSLDLSVCHSCGFGFPVNGSIDRLKTLDSQWRVVLLCRECFARVGSAKVCSYCFSSIPELDKGLLDCNMCSRRVHRTCVSLHHRNLLHSLLDADNFVCVDCCPIPQLRQDLEKSGGSISRTASRVSLEDLVKGATSISEKKATSKGKARENEAKKVMAARGSSELKRKAFDDVHLAKEPSYINLTVPDEKMALQLHQTINGSQRISRSLCPKGVSQFTVPRKEQWSYTSVVSIIESNSCTHHGKIEVGIEKKSLLEDSGKSESILTNSTLCKKDNEDLMKQVRECNAGYPEDFSLNEMDGSLKFPYSTDDSSNVVLALPCYNFNTLLKSTLPLTKHRFSCDEEGSSKLQRKSIDAIGLNGLMKIYFRKSCGSGRVMQGYSHSILSNSLFFNQENGDLMNYSMVGSTGGPRDFSLQEKESCLKFPASTDDGSNASFTIPCHSLNTCLNSTISVTKYRFGDCDVVEYSKLKRKSIDAIGSSGPMTKYFRKHWDSGRIMQGNSHSILTNSPILTRKNRVLMKQTRGCNSGCPGGFFLKDKESSLKSPEAADDVSNSGSALLSYFRFNTFSNSSMALTKYRFGDADGYGSSKLQRKSTDATAYRSIKKYSRKHWSSTRTLKGNSESILATSPSFVNENGDLTKQISACNAGYPGDVFLKEKVSSLKFLDSTNDGSNAGSALLPFQHFNSWRNSPMHPTNYSCDGNGERSKELQRKPIDAMVSENMKKYYRKRLGSKRVMQGNSRSISTSNPLFKWENGDPRMQTRGCNTSCPGDFSLKEGVSLKCPDSTDNDSNIDSALLQFHGLNTCLNSTMALRKYIFDVGDGDGYSKLQRRSIDAIGLDGSLKKYFRRNLGSSRNMHGNDTLIPP